MDRPEIYDVYDIATSNQGYYRHPALFGERLVFVSEDDLWTVSAKGGLARRLTGAMGRALSPAFSPCGDYIAYTSTEEGCPEVFVMPAAGGPARKLTYSGARQALVVGWSRDGEKIIFRSNLREPFRRQMALYEVPAKGGAIQRLDVGPAYFLSFDPQGKGRVLARHRDDLARWKGYRGGAAGQFWIDADGDGSWRPLLNDLCAGLCRPLWIDGRIFFISDHQECANIYSCTTDGDDIRRHTHHDSHYVRFASRHDKTIVYTSGAALFALDTTDDTVEEIDVDYASPRVDLKARFIDAIDYVDDFTLHPQGHSLALTSRGKAFNLGNWEGAVRQNGKQQGVRYRLVRYLNDGERLLVVSDDGGEEHFEVHSSDGQSPPVIIDTGEVDPGRALEVVVSPTDDAALFTNHRHELLHLDLETQICTVIDRSAYDRIAGITWAPDGQWVAYGFYEDFSTSTIKIANLATGQTHCITSGDFQDIQPFFDPGGRYLYFLSYRHFDPVYDQLFFELSFPRGMKPCVVTLRPDLDSPFHDKPRPLDGEDDEEGSDEGGDDDDGDFDEAPPSLSIDFEDISERVEVFPVSEGSYGDIGATEDRVFWTVFPVSGAIDEEISDSSGRLQYFDLKKRRVQTFADDVTAFTLDQRGKTIAVSNSDDLRITSASGDGFDEDNDTPGRESGLVALERISLPVDPRAEWCQMLREAWRLMRDHFWRPDMEGVDWPGVWDRYKGLLARVSTRSEFSDLVWTMQGELGTSHAYELGGDYKEPPQYQPGFLGAELTWDPTWRLVEEPQRFSGAYEITQILRGDPWNSRQSSPLLRSGLQVEEGDVILAINGQRLSATVAPGQLLANQACRQVELLIADKGGEESPRKITVRTLAEETSLRYREWVALNRRTVHRLGEGRVGYVHVPDMGALGYAEFHRQYLSENRRQALIVDVRHNGGGHVSQLLLEKLARQPLGFEIQRWGTAMAYPQEAVAGPLVALTNEEAGSDGDIFSHCFKLMKLGPLVGTRTWGGVIGVFPRHELVDGSVTTQPEFSFWFKDVGFDLENHGTEPDIDVEIPPGAGAGEEDPQLKAAIDTARELLDKCELLSPPKLDDPRDR